jgi:hypothetical protein
MLKEVEVRPESASRDTAPDAAKVRGFYFDSVVVFAQEIAHKIAHLDPHEQEAVLQLARSYGNFNRSDRRTSYRPEEFGAVSSTSSPDPYAKR